jgi:hypothetical protein
MASNKNDKQKEIEYVEFLKKRLDSEHYKANVSKEEYELTKKKYDKAKFKLKMMY